MTNWKVTMINTVEPFEKKECYITAQTIVEAYGEAEYQHPGYFIRSASFHTVATHHVGQEKEHGFERIETI